MSPWTRDLSHTIADGYFHTDLNTATDPPAITAIQCETPDPGAPQYGENRVCRLADLLAALGQRGYTEAVGYLHRTDVRMVNDRAEASWKGPIVENGCIRFHPETIRAAHRRFGGKAPEAILDVIQDVAKDISSPFHLDTGDLFLVSNHRALHYRGPCSVVFRRFPTNFLARKVFVLHMMAEGAPGLGRP
jgi:alpha-ketoglutarate-dependent taurine dioxygenase